MKRLARVSVASFAAAALLTIYVAFARRQLRRQEAVRRHLSIVREGTPA